jgi:hypothetical protein
MRARDLEVNEADTLEARLGKVRHLDGWFALQEPEPGRFRMVPVNSVRSGFRVVTGLDSEHGWITLLRGHKRNIDSPATRLDPVPQVAAGDK